MLENTETVIGTNHCKKKKKKRKVMQKCSENTATDRITSREFNPEYICI